MIKSSRPALHTVGAAPAFFNAHAQSASGIHHVPGQGDDITGTSGDDFLDGTNSRELIKGLNGADTILGERGFDTIDGGNGDDFLIGEKGGDTLYGRAGHDVISGGENNDVIVGGEGTDWAYYHNVFIGGTDGDTGVTVDLSLQGTAQDTGQGMDTLFSIEDVIGSLNNDVLTGDGGDNLLSGYFGADSLNGGGGNDYLETGGGMGAVLDGGDGEDTAFLFSGTDFDLKISLKETGEQSIASDTSVTLTNIENVSGYYYNDTIIGSDGDNKLYGDFGDDLLRGGNGNDALYGDGFDHGDGAIVTDAYSVGDDVLVGGAGDDTIVGGGGADVMSGTVGSDTFSFEFADDSGANTSDPLDHITDLTNDDAIDLTGIEANYGVTLTKVDAFTGTHGTHAETGEFTLNYNSHADVTYLKVDIDGNGNADMTVALDGNHTDFTDFVL